MIYIPASTNFSRDQLDRAKLNEFKKLVRQTAVTRSCKMLCNTTAFAYIKHKGGHVDVIVFDNRGTKFLLQERIGLTVPKEILY